MKKGQGIKKLLGFTLASVMVIGMVGCGGKTSTQTGQENNDTQVPSTQEQQSTVVESTEEVAEVTYPLDTDITLEAYGMCSLYSGATRWQDQPFMGFLEEATGVRVNYNYVAKGGDSNQLLTLMWAGDIEDMYHMVHMTGNINATIGSEYIEDELIWDLTDYLPEYAPNFWEWINREENVVEKIAVTTSDGRFYMIPQIRADNALTWIGPAIRQDWLDECGLQTPVTVEDLEKVLVTFKEKYNAKLGFASSEGSKHCGLIASGFDSLAYAFADDGASMFKISKDGEVVLPQTQPEWLEMMETLADWWERGLIDEDSLTADRAAIRAKALNNELGVIWTAASQIDVWREDAEAQGVESNWVGMEYLRTEPGAPVITARSGAARASGLGTVLTKRCSEEELIVALKWLDYGWTEEGRMMWNFGKEGVSWEMVDGKPQFTDVVKNHELGMSQGMIAYTGLGNGSGPVMQVEELVPAKSSAAQAEAYELWGINNEARSHYFPTVTLSQADQERMTTVLNTLQTLLKDNGTAFLTGQRPLSEYDDFIAELNKQGLQDALDTYSKAYKEQYGK